MRLFQSPGQTNSTLRALHHRKRPSKRRSHFLSIRLQVVDTNSLDSGLNYYNRLNGQVRRGWEGKLIREPREWNKCFESKHRKLPRIQETLSEATDLISKRRRKGIRRVISEKKFLAFVCASLR